MSRWLRLIQTGSPIRRHRTQRATLIGLGLNRIGRIRVLPDTPEIRGMITTVRHLVRVLEGPLLGTVTQEMKVQLETLRRFNRRVDRLEQSGFWRRYEKEKPEVGSRMENVSVKRTGPNTFEMKGTIYSELQEFDQDEINAFVLDYRQFTQDNDPISIGNLAKIYRNAWVPEGPRKRFEEARAKLNRHRDRPTVIAFREQLLSIRVLVDTVVYGGLAHANPEKSAVFESWEQSGIMGFIWVEFFAYLRDFMQTLKFFRLLNSHLIAIVDPPAE